MLKMVKFDNAELSTKSPKPSSRWHLDNCGRKSMSNYPPAEANGVTKMLGTLKPSKPRHPEEPE